MNENENRIIEAEARLAYEKNKYEKLLRDSQAGIAEEIYEAIHLELLALLDIAEGADDDTHRRVVRRVSRIENILNERITTK